MDAEKHAAKARDCAGEIILIAHDQPGDWWSVSILGLEVGHFPTERACEDYVRRSHEQLIVWLTAKFASVEPAPAAVRETGETPAHGWRPRPDVSSVPGTAAEEALVEEVARVILDKYPCEMRDTPQARVCAEAVLTLLAQKGRLLRADARERVATIEYAILFGPNCTIETGSEEAKRVSFVRTDAVLSAARVQP